MVSTSVGDAADDPVIAPRVILDIRPDVESDSEPFLRVLAAAEATAEGEAFVVIAPFEPRAVYPALAARGFTFQSEHVGSGEWRTCFSHLRTPYSDAPTSSLGDVSQ